MPDNLEYDAATQRLRPIREPLNSTGCEPILRALGHHPRMDRDQALSLLAEHKPILARRFGVKRLALFGSFARGTAREDSDIDLLVDFGGPATPEAYFGVQFYLEDLLQRPIDLVTERALRPQLRPYVERDAIPVR